MTGITRRRALGLGLQSMGALSLSLAGCKPRADAAINAAAFEKAQSLRERAALKGLIYGAATTAPYLEQDALHAAAFAQECGMLIVQNELKWGPLRPSSEQYRFASVDYLLRFADANQLTFRGHCLVWHISNPDWLAEALRSGNPAKLLEEHIWAVAGRYRGRVHSWDVVNEAISVKNGRKDGLRETIWLDALGPSYIERAFRTAAEADPSALLVYNDYNLEFSDEESTRKREAALRLLRDLKQKGVPLHALGIQAHLRAGRAFDPDVLTGLLDDTAGLGLQAFITELDVDDGELPRRIRPRDDGVAEAYRAYLDTALAHPAVRLVATWGLSDKYSWLNEPHYRRLGWTARPLPLDAAMRRKPAWAAMAESFERAPPRESLEPKETKTSP